MGITLISPAMGAGFVQALAVLEPSAESAMPPADAERFFYVLEGAVHVEAKDVSETLEVGGYGLFPAGTSHVIRTDVAAKLLLFEKRYVPAPQGVADAVPRMLIGREQDVKAEAFLGDEAAQLRCLIPDEPGFDMAINTFSFEPGGCLPLVECHVMEHGLLFLGGGGVYRLGESWYPVTTGDAIWMAPYLPQWFAAVGKEPARYIYYKDAHRDPLT